MLERLALYLQDDHYHFSFGRFCAEKPMSTSAGSDSRRNSDVSVCFRSSSEGSLWDSVDSLECELNAVIHRGRLSEEHDGRIREGSSGRFTGTKFSLFILIFPSHFSFFSNPCFQHFLRNHSWSNDLSRSLQVAISL